MRRRFARIGAQFSLKCLSELERRPQSRPPLPQTRTMQQQQTRNAPEVPYFVLAGAHDVSFQPDPDGSIILLRDVRNRDLYSLELQLP